MITSTTNRLLISAEDFHEYETIAASTDSNNIMPYVREAQKFDLVSVLPVELIVDLQDNGDTTLNAVLIPFVRPVLCYYSYARYITMRSATDTQYGYVQKTNEFSTPVSDKTLVRLGTEAKNLAAAYSQDLIMYLNEHAADYPLWKNYCVTGQSVRTGVKISGVSTR